jgi:hypothetical protein
MGRCGSSMVPRGSERENRIVAQYGGPAQECAEARYRRGLRVEVLPNLRQGSFRCQHILKFLFVVFCEEYVDVWPVFSNG